MTPGAVGRQSEEGAASRIDLVVGDVQLKQKRDTFVESLRADREKRRRHRLAVCLLRIFRR